MIKQTEEFNLRKYIVENGKLLSREENIELVHRLQLGDKSAEEEFILDNGKLVISVIMHEFPLYKDSDDIFQQGLIGLIDGAKRYDESFGTSVSTHCYPWIKQKIQRYIADCEDTVRIPVHMNELRIKIRQLRNKYESETENKVTFKEYVLNNIEGLSDENYRLLMQYIDGVVSLNKPVGEDEHGEVTELMDFVSNSLHDSTPSVEDTVFGECLKGDVIDILETALNPRELEIVKRRFGFGCEAETLEQIGADFNLTRERIRQIEEKAIKKLRLPKYVKMFADYTEKSADELLEDIKELKKKAQNNEDGTTENSKEEDKKSDDT